MIAIGVFDSGIGGKSVALAVQAALPDATVTFVNDAKHLPYGSKTPDQLYDLVVPILRDLATKTDVIVVACNTVSTTLVTRLRQVISVPLVAVEPMVKTAAEQTKSGVIAVCATPTTLASSRYQFLKETYAKELKVLEPDCSNWSRMIETDNVDQQLVAQQIRDVCRAGADVIVLGCTHYHWIEAIIKKIANGDARVIQPEPAVVRQLQRVIATL